MLPVWYNSFRKREFFPKRQDHGDVVTQSQGSSEVEKKIARLPKEEPFFYALPTGFQDRPRKRKSFLMVITILD
jgi:hypothetical protein